MNRRLLAAAALGLLLVSAGCTGLGGGSGQVDRAKLAQNATYDWNTTADVTFNVTGGYYHAVYRVDNRSSIALARFHRLNDRRPLPIEAVAFRYPNGTVVGAEAMNATQNRTHVTVTFPARHGEFAYRVAHRGKELRVVTAVQGSYEVVIPPATQVRYPLIGRVAPAGYRTSEEGGRVHVRWDQVTGDRIDVRYYLVRDLWIFAGMLAAGAAAALVGLSYFWLQLRELRERRQTVDVERGGR